MLSHLKRARGSKGTAVVCFGSEHGSISFHQAVDWLGAHKSSLSSPRAFNNVAAAVANTSQSLKALSPQKCGGVSVCVIQM